MNQRSNVAASLSSKRHMSLIKKIRLYFLIVLLIFSLFVWGLTNDKVKIKNIIISGNKTILSEDIINIVNPELKQNYLWFIQTDNIFLLRRTTIKSKILGDYKKIEKVSIKIRGLNSVEVGIAERESKNLWCKGNPVHPGDCYYMDSNGYVFEKAPDFTEGIMPKYFGLIVDTDPVGQLYLKQNFNNISSVYQIFKNMSFVPKSFNAISEREYEIILVDGGKIIMNDKRSLESQLTNLQALVDNKYIKTDSSSLKKIKYIDLRFGNKVNFELSK